MAFSATTAAKITKISRMVKPMNPSARHAEVYRRREVRAIDSRSVTLPYDRGLC
jgi:hypothetical protein